MSVLSVRLVASGFLGRSNLSSSFLRKKNPLYSGVTVALNFHNGSQRRMYTKATSGIEDAQTLVEREHFAKVRKQLETDPRKKITYKEFEQICTKEGLSTGQAKQLSQSLSDTALRDFVFLKPVEFNRTVSRILAELSDDTYLREQVATKQGELAILKAELQPLEAQREALERKAHRRATTIMWAGFGYCVVQAALVARLTWWELSWDVMEPVTYMLTFAVVLIGYSYFVMTGTEYTFEGLRRTLERRKLQKLLKRNGFDEARFAKLKEAVQYRDDEVMRILIDLKSDPVSLHIKDSKVPIV